MTRKEAIEKIKMILAECAEDEDAVCYVTFDDADALDMAIKALEQETCEDCVSRKAMLDAITEIDDNINMDIYTNEVREIIGDLPSVTPVRKKGHWIFVDKAHEHAHCSECGYGNVDLFNGKPHNYCPNCGAKMDEEMEG